jgi:hypothetical protein
MMLCGSSSFAAVGFVWADAHDLFTALAQGKSETAEILTPIIVLMAGSLLLTCFVRGIIVRLSAYP